VACYFVRVKPHERLAEATAPDGTRLTLIRHDGAYLLRANGAELMSTRRSHSEVELADVACSPIADRGGAHVLIGGLGLGFTLRAALRVLGPDARVTVAEIVQAVIDWNRNPDWGLSVDALGDPRVTVRHADVLDVLRGSVAAFDAIMLDVDNGAEAMVTAKNSALYRETGIRAAVAALRPGGALAYWSAVADPPFVTALKGFGLTVTTQRSRAHGSTGPYHEIIVARLSRD
jgi:spermidine synthase